MNVHEIRYSNIRHRDNYHCMICDAAEPKHKHHDVHHINGDHDNDDPPNMITLCRSCHATVTTMMQSPERNTVIAMLQAIVIGNYALQYERARIARELAKRD